jgi:hypothetical protein
MDITRYPLPTTEKSADFGREDEKQRSQQSAVSLDRDFEIVYAHINGRIARFVGLFPFIGVD